MNTSRPRNKRPRQKPGSDGDIPPWQLVIGGLLIAAGGILAGTKIGDLILSIWLPGLAR